jgi:protein phosphatase PTC6
MSPFGKTNDRDTRAILCNTDATTQPLTANHHADERTEETRLRRVGGGIVTDSFGDTRWMGALANTRWWVRSLPRLIMGSYTLSWLFSLGDSQYKRFGVTPEPDVKTRIIEGHSATALVLMSDGISSLLSDPEIADLVRTCAKLGPEVAAREIVSFAEELGSEDNCTAVVVPLKGWNTRVKDTTKVTIQKKCHISSGIDKVLGTQGVSAD